MAHDSSRSGLSASPVGRCKSTQHRRLWAECRRWSSWLGSGRDPVTLERLRDAGGLSAWRAWSLSVTAVSRPRTWLGGCLGTAVESTTSTGRPSRSSRSTLRPGHVEQVGPVLEVHEEVVVAAVGVVGRGRPIPPARWIEPCCAPRRRGWQPLRSCTTSSRLLMSLTLTPCHMAGGAGAATPLRYDLQPIGCAATMGRHRLEMEVELL